MKMMNQKVRQWENALEEMYGEGWEQLTAKEICKLWGFFEKLSPPQPHNDMRGRSYEQPKHSGSEYVAEVIAEVRFEHDNEDEMIAYFENHAFWSDEAQPLKTLVWVEANDDYSPEQDWNVRVHGLVWYDNAVSMLSDAESRMAFMVGAPDGVYETHHGSMLHVQNLNAG